MKKITIFRNIKPEYDSANFMLIYHALVRSKSFDVFVGLVETLSVRNDSIYCKAYHSNAPTTKKLLLNRDLYQEIEVSQMDYIWVNGSGSQRAYLDKMQILWILEQQCKLFNSVESLLFLSNKHWLSTLLKAHHPETYISSDIDFLLDIYKKNKAATWVIKPTAGSMGDDIFRITPNDDGESIIRNMPDLRQRKFCIFQKYVTEIEQGEKRVIVSRDKIICQYHRIHPSTNEFRTNLHKGAIATACDLTPEEIALCKKIGLQLAEYGVYFAGLDIAYPYVFEANIISPGGLSTVFQLTGKDYSDDLIDAIFPF